MCAADLSPHAARWPHPLAILHCDELPPQKPENIKLPACPVIAVGEASHPMALAADLIIEPPFQLQSLALAILAKPNAASVIVGLLRHIAVISDDAALQMESLAYAVLQGSAEHQSWLSKQPVSMNKADTAPPLLLLREEERLEITLNRPLVGNAINRAMRDALYEALELALADESIQVVDIAANGKSFSLGAELNEFGSVQDPATAHIIRQQTLAAPLLAKLAARLNLRIQGGCVGSGLEIAAWGAHLIASPDSWFQLPELKMGILPGAGGCVSLTRRIGRQRTALLALSGKRISAKTALKWGLIDQIEG